MARTDPSATRELGLSVLALDMRAAGVDVRPVRQSIGRWNMGWNVLLTFWTSQWTSPSEPATRMQALEGLLESIRSRRREGGRRMPIGAGVRRDLGRLAAEWGMLRLASRRYCASPGTHAFFPPITSVIKLAATEFGQRLASLQMDAEGDEPTSGYPSDRIFGYLWSRALTVSRGPSESHLDLIARVALGLSAMAGSAGLGSTGFVV